MSGFKYEKDSEKIVTVSLDAPASRDAISKSLHEVVERLEKDDIAGVVLVSGKDTASHFQELMTFSDQSRQAAYERLGSFKNLLRRLESLGKPVVGAISRTALGPELEIFLAAHHRIATNDPDLRIGFPELTSGLFPGHGGLVRLIYLLGLEKALPLLQNGSKLSPEQAQETGLIDELGNDDLILKAKEWIRANPEATQPWNRKGFQIPGGSPAHPRVAQTLIVMPAVLRKKFPEGNLLQESILSAAVECAQVDIESALRIESRYLIELLFAGEINQDQGSLADCQGA